MKLAFQWAASGQASPVGLLLDRSAGDVSWMSIQMLNTIVRAYKNSTYPRVVPAGTTDFAPIVADMRAAGIRAFAYAGPAAGAARVARLLADFTGPKFAAEPALDAAFAAEPAAEGWTVVAPVIGPDAASVRPFAQAFRARYGRPAGLWAAEGYDAANLLIAQLTAARTKARGGRPARKALIGPLQAAKYHGITRDFAFDLQLGQLATPASFVHQVRGGVFRYLGPAPDQPPATKAG
jgi:ABC-type branched-subunit amino acid transport system substrate-binding protein